MNEPPDDSVAFHLAKLLDEHLLRNGGYCASQIGKAENLAAEQMKQNHQFPAPLENLQRVFDASGGRRRREIGVLTFR